MAARVVLLVDPSPGRRGRIEGFLTAHYEVLSCETPDGAFALARSRTPDLALLSLGQLEGNGLQLAQQLRQNGMKEKLLAVYGKPSGKSIDDRTRRKLELAWTVDRLVLQVGHPSDLDKVVGELLQSSEKKLQSSSEDIRGMIRAEASAPLTVMSAESAQPPAPQPTWKQLLTGEITAENMKKLLGRKLF